jgi:isocitrate dehydrogenase
VREASNFRIEFVSAAGEVTEMKKAAPLLAGEVIDAAVMRAAALRTFLEAQMQDAKASGLLLSVHLKATMMKVSDPILFGHAVSVYFADVFAKHASTLETLGANPNNGFGEILAQIATLPQSKRTEAPSACDGEFGERHYQSACTQRCHH